MNKKEEFAYLLTRYLSEYLPGQKNLSGNTILSYRQIFSIFLIFLRDEKGVPVEKMEIKYLDSGNLTSFLAWLENSRGNSVSTRNQRLAAFHAFARYVMYVRPDLIYECQRILGVGFKKSEKTIVHYLSEENMQRLLAQPNQMNRSDRQNAALLSLLYDSAARVQELIDLDVRDIRSSSPAVLTLTGKGRKTRQIPLMKETAELMKQYMLENKLNSKESMDKPLFVNHMRGRFTRPGITYIINKYCKKAFKDGEIPFPVTPHVFRHSRSMHMLHAGVNIYYIKEFLGHSDLSTTENFYVRADTEMKRKALEKVSPSAIPPTSENIPCWKQDDNLLDWLKSFG